MVFAQPLFLIALSALAIPVIIHLFNFRRYRKVYFTNVRFLSEIRQETRKRSRLKHLLILLVRLLAIACLVFAFAQPYIPSRLTALRVKGKNAVSIYVDNSFSMEALTTEGPLLEVAKKKALEICAAYGSADVFQLLTNDFEGRHQRLVSQDEFRSLVEEVRLSPAVRSLEEVAGRQSDLLMNARNANLSAYLVSDFQRSTAGLAKIRLSPSIAWFFVPLAASKVSNLYIDSAWFDNPVHQPGQSEKIHARIRNLSGDQLEKIPVELTINQMRKAVASFSIDPEGTTEVTLPFTSNLSGIQSGTLALNDYPVTWDDKLYFAYRIYPAIPVLCISEGKTNAYLQAFFAGDSAFIFRQEDINHLDYSSFGQYPLLILDGPSELSTGLIQEISRYVRNGGNLLLIPGPRIRENSYNALSAELSLPSFGAPDSASLHVSEVTTQSAVFTDVFEKDAAGRVILPENVDLPAVTRYYPLNKGSASSLEDLLKLQNGQVFLGVTPAGKGRVYVFAVPFDDRFTNFPKHPLFVPTLFRIAMLSQPSLPLYLNLPADEGIEVSSDSASDREVFRIRQPGSGFEVIPEMHSTGSYTMLYPHGQIRDAGHYLITRGNTVLQGIAFNYDRRESDLRCYTSAELETQVRQANVRVFSVLKPGGISLTRQVADLSKGIPLWKYFILGALLFLLAEIILSRLLKE
ncbi:MAG TPA: BatA domain-containing protein [Bacteroidales bacterium]|nr:BatA domain-containing protein [Bacteroidales bacterium]